MYKILANLPFRTNHVHYLPSCHSTNEVARDLLPSGAAEGTLVITDNQVAGKGQMGNTWISSPGQNLTFSLILYPVFLKPNQQFLITVVLSLGIKEALAEILPGEVMIKWPNDIYFKDSKITGLLIENVLKGEIFSSCVAGIGLNVNQADFPATIKATSIKNILGNNYNLNDLLNKVLKSIADYYMLLKEGEGHKLQALYHHSLIGLGETRQFTAQGEKFTGKIIGTDQFGRLRIAVGEEIKVFQHKEVQFLS